MQLSLLMESPANVTIVTCQLPELVHCVRSYAEGGGRGRQQHGGGTESPEQRPLGRALGMKQVVREVGGSGEERRVHAGHHSGAEKTQLIGCFVNCTC